ncbi:hypothetical protein OIV83_004723 [Microbotryomycetes sp. JL201]|nr:hypothetical protein OIV83_004723 [Microbotryomycetes sp. JL201]
MDSSDMNLFRALDCTVSSALINLLVWLHYSKPYSRRQQKNSAYGTQEYWDERYSKEAPDATFDWFKTYEQGVKPLINQFIVDRGSRILMLGCGNSALSQDMYADGYKHIENIDYSPIVIDKMKHQHADKPEMSWIVGDVRRLPFEDQSMDVCIDKGTMDAMMTSGGDPWNPPDEIVQDCKAEVDEVVRVLKPSGKFIYLTWGQPHFRKRHLQRAGWNIETVEFGDGFSYFCYVMTRMQG